MNRNSRTIVVTPQGARFGSLAFPCAIGRAGTTAHKREGDRATPEGVHDIIGLLYRPDRMPKPVDWAVPIRTRDIWSDDVKDPDYNMMGSAPSRFSHEKLYLPNPLYDMIILTNWNWPYAVKGRGSAIFLHRWRKPRHPTEGCIAFDPRDLMTLAQNITFGTKIIVKPNRRDLRK